MKYIITWSHWNGLFGEEKFYSIYDAEEAAKQYERDGCKVSIEIA